MDDDLTNLVTVPASDMSSTGPTSSGAGPTPHNSVLCDQAIILLTNSDNSSPQTQEPLPETPDKHSNKRKRTEPLPTNDHPTSPSQRLAMHPEVESTLRCLVYSTPPDHNTNTNLPGTPHTLGTRAQIPTGYIVKTLRAQSTCDSNMPSDQILSIF